jgi:hypothetical protein
MGASFPVVVAFVLAILFIFVCWQCPIFWTKRFHITDTEKRAEVEDSYRKTVAQVLGGAAIVLAFSWTWLKDHRTLELDSIQTSNQQFGQAATLLGHKDVDARLGGIYSMENLVSTNSQYRMPVVNILKAVISAHQNRSVVEGAPPPKVNDDVLAAIYVLGRLPSSQSGIDLQGLYLVGGDFRSSVGFRGAKFYSAYLYRANFASADLTDANFDGAQMSDWESVGTALWSDQFIVDWWGSKAWQRVQYVVLFDYATLINASFQGTSVAGASFENADLTGTKFIRTDVSRTDFQNARNLDQATFQDSCYGPLGQPLGLSPKIMRGLTSPCKP